jgi:hypothetical protein
MQYQSVEPSSLNWAEAYCKRNQDSFINSTVMPILMGDKKKAISVLSLPAAQWSYELQLANVFRDFSFQFYGVEADEQVYKDGVALADDLTSAFNKFKGKSQFHMYHEGTTDSYLDNNPEVSYDMVYMDYFGTWSQDKKKDMRRLARGRVPGKCLVITVGLLRGRALSNDEIMQHALSGHSTRHVAHRAVNTRLRLEEGSTTWGKVEGLASVIEGIFAEEGAPCECVGLNVYDSWSQNNPERFTPEMNLVFDTRG